VLVFPGLRSGQSSKEVVRLGLSCQEYTVTAKVNVQTRETDHAGLIVGWTSDRRYSALYANPYWGTISVVDYAADRTILTSDRTIPIPVQRDFWLRADVRPEGDTRGTLTASWSADSRSFSEVTFPNIGTKVPLTSIVGGVGLTTAGVHLPEAHFDDFTVVGACQDR
jgi:hypothetical protein